MRIDSLIYNWEVRSVFISLEAETIMSTVEDLLQKRDEILSMRYTRVNSVNMFRNH